MGLGIGIGLTVMVEMFALEGGYRGFWIDQEHTTVSMDQITVAALAGRPPRRTP